MAARELAALLFLLLPLLVLARGGGIPTIGVNYGTLGNDLPAPHVAIGLLRSTGARAVKIYDANPDILRALVGVPLDVSIMVPNQRISDFAASPAAATHWVAANVLPFHGRVQFRYLLVGNEVLSDYSAKNSTWPFLVSAMCNVHEALKHCGIHNVMVGTTMAMDVLSASFPPSAGAFRPDIAKTVIKPMLQFLNRSHSSFFVDAYPYFAWASNYQSISLAYALFAGNSSTHYHDPVSKLRYTNLLDQMLDACIAAMAKLGYGNIPIVVAETGWPNNGDLDQIGANTYNAALYNRNLAHRYGRGPTPGTPARPGVPFPIFVFSLFNENQKPGPGTERHWGLFFPDGKPVYQIDLTGMRPLWSYPSLPKPKNNTPYKGPIWCVLARDAWNDTAVKDAVTYACAQGNVTCGAIQPGRECYKHGRIERRASYAFNSYWQQYRLAGGTCFFNGLAMETNKDPSFRHCKFPSTLTFNSSSQQ